jgi:DNA-directed RNA polymerase specialized sigma subunit
MNETDIVKIVLVELEKRGLIKQNDNTFKNVELLLYNYEAIKDSIKEREEQIKDLKTYGIKEKSSSITTIVENVQKQSKSELIDNAIESLQQHIFRTKVFIKYIDKIIKKLEKDEYYPIIKLKYFKGKSIEEIAEILKKDSSTISRNKNRLINELKPLLLPNEVISNIFNY